MNPYYQNEIFGQNIDQLASTHGSPLFIFSETELLKNLSFLQSAFSHQPLDLDIAISIKTNPLLAFLKIFKKEGCLGEVVTEFDFHRALEAGWSPTELIANGAGRSKDFLENLVRHGCKIHVDHQEEFLNLISLYKKLDVPPRLGLRVNPFGSIAGQWARFGFDISSRPARLRLLSLIRKNEILPEAIHFHIGSNIKSHETFAMAGRTVLELLRDCRDDSFSQLKYIDIGGGFPDFHLPLTDQDATSLSPYTFSNGMQSFFEELAYLNPQLKLVMEPGRTLFSSAGVLLTEVLHRRELPDGRPCLTLDAGLNILSTAFHTKHPLSYDLLPSRADSQITRPMMVTGPMAMGQDILYNETHLPDYIGQGHRLLFHHVGAYNTSMWWQFGYYRPRIILIDHNRNIQLVRRREGFDDLAGPEYTSNILENLPGENHSGDSYGI